MSGGGKGGKQTTQVKIPKWLEEAAQRNVGRGEEAAKVGYVPWSGPDVAAFTPMQQAAFQGTNAAASAFGLPSAQGTGMPAPQSFAGGVQGYSSQPMFDAAMANLQATRPGQYAAIQRLFVNPGTGAAPMGSAAPTAAPGAPGAKIGFDQAKSGWFGGRG